MSNVIFLVVGVCIGVCAAIAVPDDQEEYGPVAGTKVAINDGCSKCLCHTLQIVMSIMC